MDRLELLGRAKALPRLFSIANGFSQMMILLHRNTCGWAQNG
jgi:hypothetical protein